MVRALGEGGKRVIFAPRQAAARRSARGSGRCLREARRGRPVTGAGFGRWPVGNPAPGQVGRSEIRRLLLPALCRVSSARAHHGHTRRRSLFVADRRPARRAWGWFIASPLSSRPHRTDGFSEATCCIGHQSVRVREVPTESHDGRAQEKMTSSRLAIWLPRHGSKPPQDVHHTRVIARATAAN